MKFTTYSDESGISTRTKFIVTTVIVSNDNREKFQNILENVEKESGKRKKWADVGVESRVKYIQCLLNKEAFKLCSVYFHVYTNKADYVSLVSAQIAKSIISYSSGDNYLATIFLDKVSNHTTEAITKDLKLYKVKYRKIRALDDTNNVGLKFADALCGLIRDINNTKIDICYKQVYKKLKEI